MDNFNNYNNYYQGGGMSPHDYYAQVQAARVAERKAITNGAMKVAVLLILYNIFNRLFSYAFFFGVYAVYKHKITLSLDDVRTFLYDERPELIASSAFDNAANLFVLLTSVLMLMLCARIMFGMNMLRPLKPYKKAAADGAKWLPLSLTVNLLAGIVSGIITALFNESGIEVPDADFSISSPSAAALILQFTFVCAIGPVVEELIYRGIILQLLSPYGKGMAVFFSAIIFGLMHGNISQALSAFAGGLVYAAVAVRYDSIAPTIVMHILNNVVASITDFTDVLDIDSGQEIALAIEIVILFAGFYVMFVMLKGLNSDLKAQEPASVLTKKQRYSAVMFNIPMGIYFLYLIFNIIRQFIQLNS